MIYVLAYAAVGVVGFCVANLLITDEQSIEAQESALGHKAGVADYLIAAAFWAVAWPYMAYLFMTSED